MTTSAPAPAATAADQRAEALAWLAAIAEQLGTDELAVLELVAAGLARGRAVYGELEVARDRRDFRTEAGDEVRDALVYLAAELLRLNRRGQAITAPDGDVLARAEGR